MFDICDLQARGFVGFRALGSASLPDAPGVYAVLRGPTGPPRFLARSVGGKFKGIDGSVPVRTLEAKVVAGTPLVYLGRAQRLSERHKLLVRYGAGEAVAHRGDRYLWQLADHGELRIAWCLQEDPVTAEAILLAEFEHHFGKLPFANLVRGTQLPLAA